MPDTRTATAAERTFDVNGRQTAGPPLNLRTDQAIATFNALEYMRLKLARQEAALEDAVALVPAGEMGAYVAATQLILDRNAELITAIDERRAARRRDRHGRQ
jgi:hypothetical protein